MSNQKSLSFYGYVGVSILLYSVVFLVFLAPLLRLFLVSLTQNGGGYGLCHYARLLGEPRTQKAFFNTLVIGLGASGFSTIGGVVLAFLVAYTNLKRKTFIEVLILMPFIIPTYITTLSWTSLLAPQGMVCHLFELGGIPPVNLYSLQGIIFMQGMCSIPLVYLITKSMLQRIPLELEWASWASGLPPLRTLFRIHFPLILPAAAGGGVLSFLAAIDNFSIPAFLGISSGIPVLSTYIYEKAIGFGPSSFSDAAVLSVFLALMALGGTLAEGLCFRKSRLMESVGESETVRLEIPKKIRCPLEATLLLLLGGFTVVPLGFMILKAFQKSYGLGYGRENLTLFNFQAILSNQGMMSSLANSLTFALVTSIICVFLGTLTAYLKVRTKNPLALTLERSASLTYAIPGMVLALSMIFHWVEPLPGIRPGIYGTKIILIVAYVTRYLILQIKGSVNTMLTIHPSLEEAALASGNSQVSIWGKILVPLMAKPVLATAFLVFIPAMTELTLSSILSAAGTKTLGLTVFNLQQAGEDTLSAAMSSLIVLLVFGIYGIALYCKRTSRKHCREVKGENPCKD